MDMEIEGRTALITGASSGLGRAMAVRFATEGVHVIAVGRRKAQLESLGDEIYALSGARPVLVTQDLRTEGAVDHIVREAGHGVDIVVNNAGGSAPVSFETAASEWQSRMLVNFERARELAHALLPGMLERRWGRILNITGVQEPRGLNATLPAKAALTSWAKGLSRAVARQGVTVNCIAPGRIYSDQVTRDFTPADVAAFADAEIPAGRFGEGEEFADVALFLVSERARYVTGTTVTVDGGFARA